jgi:hypothetical protein
LWGDSTSLEEEEETILGEETRRERGVRNAGDMEGERQGWWLGRGIRAESKVGFIERN